MSFSSIRDPEVKILPAGLSLRWAQDRELRKERRPAADLPYFGILGEMKAEKVGSTIDIPAPLYRRLKELAHDLWLRAPDIEHRNPYTVQNKLAHGLSLGGSSFRNLRALKNTFAHIRDSRARSPKFWADAYLLAFAEIAGLKLVTFARALHSRGADVLVLWDPAHWALSSPTQSPAAQKVLFIPPPFSPRASQSQSSVIAKSAQTP